MKNETETWLNFEQLTHPYIAPQCDYLFSSMPGSVGTDTFEHRPASQGTQRSTHYRLRNSYISEEKAMFNPPGVSYRELNIHVPHLRLCFILLSDVQ